MAIIFSCGVGVWIVGKSVVSNHNCNKVMIIPHYVLFYSNFGAVCLLAGHYYYKLKSFGSIIWSCWSLFREKTTSTRYVSQDKSQLKLQMNGLCFLPKCVLYINCVPVSKYISIFYLLSTELQRAKLHCFQRFSFRVEICKCN